MNILLAILNSVFNWPTAVVAILLIFSCLPNRNRSIFIILLNLVEDYLKSRQKHRENIEKEQLQLAKTVLHNIVYIQNTWNGLKNDNSIAEWQINDFKRDKNTLELSLLKLKSFAGENLRKLIDSKRSKGESGYFKYLNTIESQIRKDILKL